MGTTGSSFKRLLPGPGRQHQISSPAIQLPLQAKEAVMMGLAWNPCGLSTGRWAGNIVLAAISGDTGRVVGMQVLPTT